MQLISVSDTILAMLIPYNTSFKSVWSSHPISIPGLGNLIAAASVCLCIINSKLAISLPVTLALLLND